MARDSIDDDGFRANVGIVICNAQSEVLWARRAGQGGWQFPQGGILEDESPLQAMYRELREEVGLEPGDFVHTFGDVHIYLNHLDQVQTQLSREPFPLPEMRINPERRDLFDFQYDDFELRGYQCHPAIRAPIAV